MRLVVRFGNQLPRLPGRIVGQPQPATRPVRRNLDVRPQKRGALFGNEKRDNTIGDAYLYTALDTDTKLLVTFAIGKRNSEVTAAFIADLEKRLVRQPVGRRGRHAANLDTDGWGPYGPCIARSFGRSVRHGVLIKQYVNPDVGRYAPPALIKADRINVQGISDLDARYARRTLSGAI